MSFMKHMKHHHIDILYVIIRYGFLLYVISPTTWLPYSYWYIYMYTIIYTLIIIIICNMYIYIHNILIYVIYIYTHRISYVYISCINHYISGIYHVYIMYMYISCIYHTYTYISCIYHIYIYHVYIMYISPYSSLICNATLPLSPICYITTALQLWTVHLLRIQWLTPQKPCFGKQFTHVTVHRVFYIRGIGRFLNLWDVFRGTTSVHLLIIFYGIISETCRQNHPVSKPMWLWKIPSWRLTHAVVEVVCPNTAFGKDWDWSELI